MKSEKEGWIDLITSCAAEIQACSQLIHFSRHYNTNTLRGKHIILVILVIRSDGWVD